jgi:hypothetical protein
MKPHSHGSIHLNDIVDVLAEMNSFHPSELDIVSGWAIAQNRRRRQNW